jgi:hypothetical protein
MSGLKPGPISEATAKATAEILTLRVRMTTGLVDDGFIDDGSVDGGLIKRKSDRDERFPRSEG